MKIVSLSMLVIISFLISPSIFLNKNNTYIYAQNNAGDNSFGYGLVRCDGVLNPNEKNRDVVCSFKALVDTVNFFIYKMIAFAVPLSVALLVWSGYLYMSGKQDNISLAKRLFKNVVIGFIIMLTAWFVVTTLVNYLADPNIGATILVK